MSLTNRWIILHRLFFFLFFYFYGACSCSQHRGIGTWWVLMTPQGMAHQLLNLDRSFGGSSFRWTHLMIGTQWGERSFPFYVTPDQLLPSFLFFTLRPSYYYISSLPSRGFLAFLSLFSWQIGALLTNLDPCRGSLDDYSFLILFSINQDHIYLSLYICMYMYGWYGWKVLVIS